MADTNHTLVRPRVYRATFCLARYRALQAVRLRYRDAGIKITGIPASQLRDEAVAYISAHPEPMAQAAADVPKLLINAPRKAR